MNPRAEGVFEAISYVREFLNKHRGKAAFVDMLENELDVLISDLSRGVAVDFRTRLRLI